MRMRDRSNDKLKDRVRGGDAAGSLSAADGEDQREIAGDQNAVLDVRHVSVDYAGPGGAAHAVTDVSFTLGRGEVLGLAGESGSGKSTLAYAIARLLRPPARIVRGEVLFWPDRAHGDTDGAPAPVNVFGLSTRDLQAFRWRRLAIVFQSAMNALNPVMSVGGQITDVLRAHEPAMSGRQCQERAAELLRLVGVAPEHRRSFPHELSGGMRQRVNIAIALALNPDVVIMDEPTTALDVVVQRDILAEIMRLRARLGFSVIFITHDLSLLLEIADRVAIMYAGRLAELAPAAELRAHPRHPYTEGLLHSFPMVRGPRIVLSGIPGLPPDLRALPAGCAFQARCPRAFDACQVMTPPLRPYGTDPGRVVACHLYDEAPRPTADLPAALIGQDVAPSLHDEASLEGEMR